MYLRRCFRVKNGKRHAYWALVESYRTAKGPRQRTIACLGDMSEAQRLGVKAAVGACGGEKGASLFEEAVSPEWVEVDASKLRVERVRDFGGAWLGLEIAKRLGLPGFLELNLTGIADVPWSITALALVLGRLIDPSSELRFAEHVYERTAMSELLGVPAGKMNDDRLYRALDKLLPHKDALQKHLKDRLGELFGLKYDLLLYDVTSTYFEGQCEGNPQAKRGYSRDHRSDCKQVCIALVVSKCGMPVGYEVFDGNRVDVTTVEEIVEKIEEQYGKSDRVWVMDRGMVSKDNVAFLNQEKRRYILGTSKHDLKRYERELAEKSWTQVHEGLEVRKVPAPGGPEGSDEVFILCRSADRKEKEKAMHEKFAGRIEAGLTAMQKSCEKKKQDPLLISRRLGRLLGKNTRGEGAFKVEVITREDGGASLKWEKNANWQTWASLSEGCYLLRTNITDWTPEELWKAYMQLTQAEAAFRIHKSDLSLRPVWHQKKERVQAHILVCFLAYVLWKTLGQMCHAGGLGDEPRKVLDELCGIRSMDVVLPTRSGVELRRRLVSQPTEHQAILLAKLGLRLPQRLAFYDGV